MAAEFDAIGGIGSGGVIDGPASVAPATAPAPARQAPSEADLQAAVQRINDYLASSDRVLELKVDSATKLTVAVIKDNNTGEMLQQFPNQDSVDLAQMLASWSHGGNVLLDLIT
jgi:uncharacterized FlaG/YvyC family protein